MRWQKEQDICKFCESTKLLCIHGRPGYMLQGNVEKVGNVRMEKTSIFRRLARPDPEWEGMSREEGRDHIYFWGRGGTGYGKGVFTHNGLE